MFMVQSKKEIGMKNISDILEQIIDLGYSPVITKSNYSTEEGFIEKYCVKDEGSELYVLAPELDLAIIRFHEKVINRE